MTRIAWLTDIHLNFLDHRRMFTFLDKVRALDADAYLISGDIGEADSVCWYLHGMESRLAKPIYFVLGNHDFYYGSMETVRAAVGQLSAESSNLIWLTRAGVLELAPEVGLVGHDGWADGRCGDYARSRIMLNDYLLIREFQRLDSDARLAKLNVLGDEAADCLRRPLSLALERYPRVIVATHVPPFEDACWHQGKVTNDDYLPHYACKALGDVLLELAQAYPSREITVLCGHTHTRREVEVLPNLRVLTGEAEYHHPAVQEVFELE